MNTASPTFRFIGTTDDTTTCENCGREELRSTVILATLDADGNTDGTVYYGTTCAARALKARFGVKMTRTQIINAAVSAETDRRSADRFARELLTHYGLPLTGGATDEQIAAAAPAYAAANYSRNPRFGGDVEAAVRDMLTRRQAQVIV